MAKNKKPGKPSVGVLHPVPQKAAESQAQQPEAPTARPMAEIAKDYNDACAQLGERRYNELVLKEEHPLGAIRLISLVLCVNCG